ncbi:MAG: hypothetical protein ACT4N2_10680 [Hyphomicrobium sp.]
MGFFSKLLAGGDGGSIDDGDTPEERQRRAAEAALDRMIAARASQPAHPASPETRTGDRRSGQERRVEPGQSAEDFVERRLGGDRRRTGGEPASPASFGRRPARPGQT